jgi:hypothetical protein
MTPTNRTTIGTRVSQCMAATALIAGIAFGATPIAGAERVWDLDKYDKCLQDLWLRNPNPPRTQGEISAVRQLCCQLSGGVLGPPSPTEGNRDCTAPAPEAENVPQPPGQTTTPPVLQNPPQTSNPLIPVPRGPNSGTLAP